MRSSSIERSDMRRAGGIAQLASPERAGAIRHHPAANPVARSRAIVASWPDTSPTGNSAAPATPIRETALDLVRRLYAKARPIVRRNYPLLCLSYVVKDLLFQFRTRFNIESGSGTTHAVRDTDDSLNYIEGVFNDYLNYAGIDGFHGRVAEIGAGDNCGVAMLILGSGAQQVDLPDRFFSRRDDNRHATIYEALWERFPSVRLALGNPRDGKQKDYPGIQRMYGEAAACEKYFERNGDYDFIVSRSVLEHLFDVPQALRSMATGLVPGGKLIHKVDLRDHGMFTPMFHELKFLEAPAILHRRMTQASGRPNRALLNVYTDTLEQLGLRHKTYVTRLAGVGEITPHLPYDEIPVDLRKQSLAYVRSHRRNFAREYDAVSDEVLSVAGFFLVAEKPQG